MARRTAQGEEKEPLEKMPMAPAGEAATDLVVAKGQDVTETEEEGTDAGAAKKDKEAKAKVPSVPLWKLYSRADSIDLLLMALGSFGAICLGAAMPCLSLLFGQLTNSFGNTVADPSATLGGCDHGELPTSGLLPFLGLP